MVAIQDKPLEQNQRIQVEMDGARGVKVRVESYDPALGWYTSASIALPLHQVALLEQALSDMRGALRAAQDPAENIIAFPGRTLAA